MMKTICVVLLLAFSNHACAQKLSQEDYSAKAKYIWNNFVPESGQAEFVQGELLRAIEKLNDEAQRNGNANFHKKCHGLLIQYLKEKLSDVSIFDTPTIKQIHKDLNTLNKQRQPFLEDDVYDFISNRIVDWYLFYGDGVKHLNNADLQC